MKRIRVLRVELTDSELKGKEISVLEFVCSVTLSSPKDECKEVTRLSNGRLEVYL